MEEWLHIYLIRSDIGLYRDDDSAIFKNISGPKSGKIKKDVQKLFKEKELDIVIQGNMNGKLFRCNTEPWKFYLSSIPKKKKNHIKYINIESFYKSLNKSGYKHKLKYKANTDTAVNKKQRQRNIIWINPPSSKNVKSNIRKKLLNLIKKHFLPHHKFHKLSKTNYSKN